MDLLVAWTQLKKKISELEDISIETCKIEKPREKSGEKKKPEQNIQELYDYTRCNIYVMGISEEEREEQKKYLHNNDGEFSQINVRQ